MLNNDPHPQPTFEEIACKFTGFSEFSIIDLKDAFHQLPVDEESKQYLIIATHRGYFTYKTMPFGIKIASAKFQKFMDTLLQDLEGVAWLQDDIATGGKTRQEHIMRLRLVLNRLRDAGLKTQIDKIHLFQPSIKFLGYRWDKEGVHPTHEGVDALRELRSPKNVSELRSFLGSINYYSRFLKDLQSRCSILNSLLQKNKKWEWTPEHERVFQSLKGEITADKTIVHYDPNLPIILSTDASNTGIGAVIQHRYKDNSLRPIAAASRALTKAEQNFSTIDREGLAIIFGVNKFFQYLCGRNFIIQTDHKPLERIFGENSSLPKIVASRLSRWALTLSNYDYTIEHIPGREMCVPDCLSRLFKNNDCTKSEEPFQSYDSLNEIRTHFLHESNLTNSRLKHLSWRDETLKTIFQLHERGWPPKRNLDDSIIPFYEKRDELSIENGVLLWQNRLVIPKSLQTCVLQKLHEGHPGIVAMKSLARIYIWWPGIDRQIETYVGQCSDCQKSQSDSPETPLYLWNTPDSSWDRLHIDFLGPFEGKMWFVVIDAFSRWLEIFPMTTATTENAVVSLRSLFSKYGICKSIVSDNGPQFRSTHFKQFCHSNGVKLILTTPYHSRTNGRVERVIRTFKNRYLRSKTQFPDPTHRMQVVLFTYRTTPHSSTGKSPAELFLGRKLTTVFDRMKPDTREKMDRMAFKSKMYHDRSSQNRDFNVGDLVWFKRKVDSEWIPASVLEKTGDLSYHVKVGEDMYRAHADQMRSRLQTGEDDQTATENDSRFTRDFINSDPHISSREISTQRDIRRSSRHRQQPARLEYR
ncbi:Hypothetical Protein NTJ_02555 [Nesidiocoris tenuis]|uniref:RNA-directed DNA polymerase n=1 Tax=Nesidiocoris tenuis TaxID=355587 RepID=A0ABN7ACH2_9HEMI|nr:Hypothetical Protein NTJ_02555 [Nesidiocoris tenuis]